MRAHEIDDRRPALDAWRSLSLEAIHPSMNRSL